LALTSYPEPPGVVGPRPIERRKPTVGNHTPSWLDVLWAVSLALTCYVNMLRVRDYRRKRRDDETGE
jgi:hypothetical protein